MRSRLGVFYVSLALLTALVAVLVVDAGADRTPQPSIAGGYDVSGAESCLGAQVDLQQSGQFVNLDNSDGTVAGKLRFEGARLTGDVKCAAGGTHELRAEVADGTIKGSVSGRAFRAELQRDPPEPGAQEPRAAGSLAGHYRVTPRSGCLGGAFDLEGSGSRYELGGEGIAGEVSYRGGLLAGSVTCKSGQEWELTGQSADRSINNLVLAPPEAPEPAQPGAAPAGGERVTAEKQREFGKRVALFLLAVAIVMLIARAFGELAVRLRQPRVMGEVVAGIALGPTVFGKLMPDLQASLFASDILPTIGLVANLGLIFYMFLVGLELDPAQLKGRMGQAAAISNASVALPMMLGIAVALPIYELVGPDQKFVAFAIYMGVAMSITAFPVLARILVERRMLKRPVGALTMACAAIDDVTAWFLIALATAVAAAGSGTDVITTVALAAAFCAVMVVVVRPLLGRVSAAYDEAGRVPGGWIAAIFAGILLSAFATEEIGIAVIFGAFIMGAIMPRNAGLTEDVTRRVEDFVVTLLLPLFFAFTGLRTNIGLLDRPELWAMTGALVLVAIAGKWLGAMLAARLTGFDWRASNVIGALMNTRGLTELIVLNLALEAGVISEALFAMLVIMALVTTFMAGPALNLLDPKNTFGAPLEEELADARRASLAELPAIRPPDRSILVATQSAAAMEQLRAVAEPLARSEPPRELILARLVPPPRGAAVRGGLQSERKALDEAEVQLRAIRGELGDEGVASRVVAVSSSRTGQDLSQLAAGEEIDLVLLDGARRLLGDGVPRGAVGTLLERAPSDVAVLVAREDAAVAPGPERPVTVPFGGQEHDWAALELGAWLASTTGASLRLLGAAGQSAEQTKVRRVLDDAGVLVRQYAGVTPEAVIATGDGDALAGALSGAGLLVIGLSERWRSEGLGHVRSEIARSSGAPVLFVRRGQRPGALAPRSDVTRFTWSSANLVSPVAPA